MAPTNCGAFSKPESTGDHGIRALEFRDGDRAFVQFDRHRDMVVIPRRAIAQYGPGTLA